MEALGKVLKDKGDNSLFSLRRHEGVFEAVGVEAIEQWISQHGEEYLPHIASHFGSPMASATGTVTLTEVLHWLFSKHEFNDAAFQGFLQGRHRLASWWGNNKAQEVEQEMQVFLHHDLRRVKEWAAREIEHWKWVQNWSDELDEKTGTKLIWGVSSD